MRQIITCPRALFQSAVQRLGGRRASTALFARLGSYTTANQQEWLVRDLQDEPPSAEANAPYLRLVRTVEPPARPLPWPLPVIGHVYLGDAWLRGHWYGYVHAEQTVVDIAELYLIGAGMHHLPGLYVESDATDSLRGTSAGSIIRWSRTIGALGDLAIYTRLARLHIGVVGNGRSGSALAQALVRLGVRRLTLIDGDAVELHNLGEMAVVLPGDVGENKAVAVARRLEEVAIPTIQRIDAVPGPMQQRESIIAAKQCDVLFTCVDSDDARLATAMVATLYHRVLIDIGAGIHRLGATDGPANSSAREMGADVRLIVPGDGCLVCRGNLVNFPAAVTRLSNQWATSDLHIDWREQRAGSLASHNQLAVAVGVRMLEDLVAERIHASRWTRMQYSPQGRLEVVHPSFAESEACSLCARAGLGDSGLGVDPRPIHTDTVQGDG